MIYIYIYIYDNIYIYTYMMMIWNDDVIWWYYRMTLYDDITWWYYMMCSYKKCGAINFGWYRRVFQCFSIHFWGLNFDRQMPWKLQRVAMKTYCIPWYGVLEEFWKMVMSHAGQWSWFWSNQPASVSSIHRLSIDYPYTYYRWSIY